MTGVEIWNCDHGQLIGNRIEDLTLTPEALAVVGPQSDGFECANSSHLVFQGNIVRNVGEGIDLAGPQQGCQSCVISGNTFDGCLQFGITS